jgi:hypothetical protein
MLYLFTYSIYIIISLIITFYVGNRLYRDGEVWLLHLFQAEDFTKRLNRLLLLGYYLVNVGYIFFSFISWGEMNSIQDCIQILSKKVGIICLILGYLHYQNILLISIMFNLNLLKKWKL